MPAETDLERTTARIREQFPPNTWLGDYRLHPSMARRDVPIRRDMLKRERWKKLPRPTREETTT